MKNAVTYGSLFVAVFIFTTVGIIYLHSNYNNIFKFDFSPKTQALKADSTQHSKTAAVKPKNEPDKNEPAKNEPVKNEPAEETKPQTVASAKDTNSVPAHDLVNIDPALIDSLKMLQKEIEKLKKSVNENKTQATQLAVKTDEKPSLDTLYAQWMKKTASLYESMDAKKAAKIIQNYSDNVARDIIYAMKKKKAAEILSQLNPEFANRITQVR